MCPLQPISTRTSTLLPCTSPFGPYFSHLTMIYTSYHGQNLHERGAPGLSTHCSVEPLQEEGLVPLVVIDGNRDLSMDWRRDVAHNHNRSSHYMVFPTLLELMGYDPSAVEKRYGRALNEDRKSVV